VERSKVKLPQVKSLGTKMRNSFSGHFFVKSGSNLRQVKTKMVTDPF